MHITLAHYLVSFQILKDRLAGDDWVFYLSIQMRSHWVHLLSSAFYKLIWLFWFTPQRRVVEPDFWKSRLWLCFSNSFSHSTLGSLIHFKWFLLTVSLWVYCIFWRDFFFPALFTELRKENNLHAYQQKKGCRKLLHMHNWILFSCKEKWNYQKDRRYWKSLC